MAVFHSFPEIFADLEERGGRREELGFTAIAWGLCQKRRTKKKEVTPGQLGFTVTFLFLFF